MKFALFSPPPLYRPVAVPHHVRFGVDAEEWARLVNERGRDNSKPQPPSHPAGDAFDCGGQCKSTCRNCATGKAKIEAIKNNLERHRGATQQGVQED